MVFAFSLPAYHDKPRHKNGPMDYACSATNRDGLSLLAHQPR
jgi:hypothetical protein